MKLLKKHWPLVWRKTRDRQISELSQKLHYAENNFIGEAVSCPTNGTFFTTEGSGEKLMDIVTKASSHPKAVICKRVKITRQHGRWCSDLLPLEGRSSL